MTDSAAPSRETMAERLAHTLAHLHGLSKVAEQETANAIREAEQAAAARGRKEGMEEAARIAHDYVERYPHEEYIGIGGGYWAAEEIEGAIRERAGQEEG